MASEGRTTVGGGAIVEETAQKVFAAGRWLVGWSGWAAGADVIRQILPDIEQASSAWEIRGLLRAACERSGWVGEASSEGGPKGYPLDVLVACPDGAWQIFNDGSVTPLAGRFWGAGSGWKFAVGAALGLQESAQFSPEEILRRALSIAIACDSGSGGQVVVRETPSC